MLTVKQRKFKRLVEAIAKKQLKEQTYTIEEIPADRYDRMHGLVNSNSLHDFIDAAADIMATLTDEGFEAKEILHYLYIKLVNNV